MTSATVGSYRVGEVLFKKSANGVNIEFEDASHSLVEISDRQFQELLTNLGYSGIDQPGSMRS